MHSRREDVRFLGGAVRGFIRVIENLPDKTFDLLLLTKSSDAVYDLICDRPRRDVGDVAELLDVVEASAAWACDLSPQSCKMGRAISWC